MLLHIYTLDRIECFRKYVIYLFKTTGRCSYQMEIMQRGSDILNIMEAEELWRNHCQVNFNLYL
jgi:hypothetical protein